MTLHTSLTATEIRSLLKRGVITLGGNKKLKIFGTLHCKSGKRMLKQNRVFFSSVYEAKHLGYRPCGHCMKEEYKKWKLHNEPI